MEQVFQIADDQQQPHQLFPEYKDQQMNLDTDRVPLTTSQGASTPQKLNNLNSNDPLSLTNEAQSPSQIPNIIPYQEVQSEAQGGAENTTNRVTNSKAHPSMQINTEGPSLHSQSPMSEK